MNAHVKLSLRLLAALAVAGAVIAAGGWAGASGRAATPSLAAATNSTAPATSWCCPGGGGQGLTVTGQATVRGRGTAARDEAITKAVADATDQAKAAAAASGITLGQIVGMQVSAWPYPIPFYEGAAGGAAGLAPASSSPAGPATIEPGSGTSVCANDAGCPVSAPATPCICTPARAMVPQQSASVTITWAIG